MNSQEENLIISAIHIAQHECHENALQKGFWEDEDKILSLCLKEDTPARERIISLFNSEKVALEHSELSERLETLRNDPTKLDEHCSEFLNLEIEVADSIIRALDFAGRRHLRVGEALIAKMNFNRTREYKHGKNF